MKYDNMPRVELIQELKAWENKFEDIVSDQVKEKEGEYCSKIISISATAKELRDLISDFVLQDAIAAIEKYENDRQFLRLAEWIFGDYSGSLKEIRSSIRVFKNREGIQ